MVMIECPRCGFAQPKDQYCASCGVNMDALLAKPKPLWVRILQNPNFHLSLIFMLILIVVGWIFYTQSSTVKREVRQLLDLPIASRDAGDPNEIREDSAAAAKVEISAEEVEAAPEPAAQMAAAPELETAATADAKAKDAAAAKPPQKIEMSFWEIPREVLAPLITSAQRAGESSGGRAYYWSEGAKVLDTLQTSGATLALSRTMNIQANAHIDVETPPTAPEMFQFALQVQIVKPEVKDLSVRWVANIILPQMENPNSTAPAVRAALESNMSGNSSLAAQGVLMLVVEPANRSPRDEYLQKAGEGPWSIFSSPEFRQGITEWVIVLTPK